jgi:hypothetical protein
VKIETLRERRKINDMAQAYKLTSGRDRVDSVRLFNYVPAGRTRMAADPLNIRPEFTRTDVRKNFFSQRIVTEWNKIPNEIKTSSNVQLFKERYRKFASTQE